jgi:hypothetical protein
MKNLGIDIVLHKQAPTKSFFDINKCTRKLRSILGIILGRSTSCASVNLGVKHTRARKHKHQHVI